MTGLLPALAGANIIYGMGMLESAMTMSYPQMVADADFGAMIQFAVKGILINDETMSVDHIKEVGSKGDFLGHKNTFKYRKIQSQPKLIDRKSRAKWEAAGSLSMFDRAYIKAKELLMTHKPEALSESVLAQLEALVLAADKELDPRNK